MRSVFHAPYVEEMEIQVIFFHLILHAMSFAHNLSLICSATKFLSEMKSTFGANASQLLYINSSGEGLVEHLQNPWIFSPVSTFAGSVIL